MSVLVVNARWYNRPETPVEIAKRIDQSIRDIRSRCGVDWEWTTLDTPPVPWPSQIEDASRLVAREKQEVSTPSGETAVWFSNMLAFWRPGSAASMRNLGTIMYEAGAGGSPREINTASFLYRHPVNEYPSKWEITRNALLSLVDAWEPEHAVMTSQTIRGIQRSIPQIEAEIGFLTYVTWGSPADWSAEGVIVKPYRNGLILELDIPPGSEPTREWLMPILRTYLIDRKLTGKR